MNKSYSFREEFTTIYRKGVTYTCRLQEENNANIQEHIK